MSPFLCVRRPGLVWLGFWISGSLTSYHCMTWVGKNLLSLTRLYLHDSDTFGFGLSIQSSRTVSFTPRPCECLVGKRAKERAKKTEATVSCNLITEVTFPTQLCCFASWKHADTLYKMAGDSIGHTSQQARLTGNHLWSPYTLADFLLLITLWGSLRIFTL